MAFYYGLSAYEDHKPSQKDDTLKVCIGLDETLYIKMINQSMQIRN